MCDCVCEHVCTHVCVCIYVCAHVYICMHVCRYVYVHACNLYLVRMM